MHNIRALETEHLMPIESPRLANLAQNGIVHGFFTRQGGVSAGIYDGLNTGLGSRDVPANVLENRRRVAGWFGAPLHKLAGNYQVHSAVAVTIEADYAGERPPADALVTAAPGVVLSVLSADCGPILFADPDAKVVGAAHAGWKGALDGVLEATIEAMIAKGARRETITASLGPSISKQNYEVGPEFIDRFLARDACYAQFFAPSPTPGHAMFDLPGLSIHRLRKAGVIAENLDLCTYSDETRFYSYRRATHRNEGDHGRLMSAIQIKEH